MFVTPSYTFSDPVLNGQLWLGVDLRRRPCRDAACRRVLSGPFGSASRRDSDFMTGVGDLYPLATLKWQLGNHNIMTYATAVVPVGAYDATRLAGIGIGHWAIDGGLGYTFANDAGLEFSVTAGVTYNFMNPHTRVPERRSTATSTGVRRSRWARSSTSARSATSTIQLSPDIGGPARCWARSSRR